MITCKSGLTIRTSITKIREAGRATQGVKLIKLDEGDEIAAITTLDEHETDDDLAEVVADETTQIILEGTDTTNIAKDASTNEQDNIDEESDEPDIETEEKKEMKKQIKRKETDKKQVTF